MTKDLQRDDEKSEFVCRKLVEFLDKTFTGSSDSNPLRLNCLFWNNNANFFIDEEDPVNKKSSLLDMRNYKTMRRNIFGINKWYELPDIDDFDICL